MERQLPRSSPADDRPVPTVTGSAESIAGSWSAAAGSVSDGRMHCLIVEDEETIVEFLRTGLTYEGHRTTVAADGEAALRLAQEQTFDLVILDVMLPGIDGLTVCRRLRGSSDVPIIVLTARKEVADRVAGLDAGADDYLTKPFSFAELLARMRAVLRRRGQALEADVLTRGDLSLDLERHTARLDGRPLDLTPIEFALLALFMRHPRRVFTRETLLHRVWGEDHSGAVKVVDVHMSRLRQKIGEDHRGMIRTIYGIGYELREG